MNCHCGKNKPYKECCQILHLGIKTAANAEELMRSRYSAFATKNFSYLTKTQDPKTMHLFDIKTNQNWANSVTFVRLEILNFQEKDQNATVEFKAHYQLNSTGEIKTHHEKSLFRKDQGLWYYVVA